MSSKYTFSKTKNGQKGINPICPFSEVPQLIGIPRRNYGYVLYTVLNVPLVTVMLSAAGTGAIFPEKVPAIFPAVRSHEVIVIDVEGALQ